MRVRATIHHRRLAKGLCSRCGKDKPAKGKTMCGSCLHDLRQRAYEAYHAPGRKGVQTRAKIKASNHRRWERLKKAGMCVACGQRPWREDSDSHCSECLTRMRAKMAAIHKALRARGVCLHCHKAKIAKDRSRSVCRACLDKAIYTNTRRRAKLLRRGICVECGTFPIAKDRSKRACSRCLDKIKERALACRRRAAARA